MISVFYSMARAAPIFLAWLAVASIAATAADLRVMTFNIWVGVNPASSRFPKPPR